MLLCALTGTGKSKFIHAYISTHLFDPHIDQGHHVNHPKSLVKWHDKEAIRFDLDRFKNPHIASIEALVSER